MIVFVFFLIAIPPLVGGRIAVGLLPVGPARRLAQVEKYGMLIIICILIGLPWLGSLIGATIQPFAWVILPMVEALISGIAHLAGLI